MTFGLGLLVVLSLANLVLLGLLFSRSAPEPVERALRDESRQNRDDAGRQARELREELGQSIKSSADTLVKAVGELGGLQKGQLDSFGTQLATLTQSTQERLDGIRSVVKSQLTEIRDTNEDKLREVSGKLTSFQDIAEERHDAIRRTLDEKLQTVQEQMSRAFSESTQASHSLRDEAAGRLTAFQESIENRHGAMRQTVDDKLQTVQEHTTKASREFREELKAFGDTMHSRLDALKGAVDTQLRQIQDTNSKKLDEIRRTVDEQLQNTLEKRLAEQFTLVNAHLESVQRGLGEMKGLAEGVDDLQRVLTNVKARGTWAEVQLGGILAQILTPEQFGENVQTRDDSSERVEYAVRLPGPDDDHASCVWLPIDSKFPRASYERLVDAADAGDAPGVDEATTDLKRDLRACAQRIRDRFLAPPKTTDFAILFLPTEGLYAEVLRQRDLANELQQTFRVMVAGPTTLAALLSSLRMGFKTLAIQRHASDVWRILAAVKKEFGTFGDVLGKVRRQLDQATRTIDDLSGRRTRAMERRLREVEELPPGIDAADILRLPGAPESPEEQDDEDDFPLFEDGAEPYGA